ncbi:MAG: hypothetical protein N2745_02005 [Syntrophorhabdaceae bacterium]|nr:hypothetical protein [Syntrophorhabdaceae bacterium]
MILKYFTKCGYGLLFFLSFLSLFLSIKYSINGYDEGIVVFGAHRIMQGEVPYRDFWAVYPPGQFYMNAAMFTLFGETVIVARVYHTFICFFIAICFYYICTSFFSKKVCALALGTVSLWLSANTFYGYPIFPALLANLLSIMVFFEYIEKRESLPLFLSGILIGLALLFRLDFAIYGAVAQIIPLIAVNLKERPITLGIKTLLKNLTVYILGIFFFPLPYCVYLGFAGGLDEAFGTVVIFASTTMLEVNRLPYPHPIPPIIDISLSEVFEQELLKDMLHWLRFYCPIFVYTVAIVLFLKECFSAVREKRKERDVNLFKFLTLLITGIMMLGQALNRYDWIHVLPTSFFAVIVFLWLFEKARGVQKKWYRLSVMLLSPLLFLTYTMPFLMRITNNVNKSPPLGCHSSLERAGCVRVPVDQEEMVHLVVDKTGIDERIFVGNYKHDAIWANDIIFYFLADRPCATYYHELSPGVATTLLVQKNIVRELMEKEIKWVVIVNITDPPEGDAKSKSSGINYLDRFIMDNYRHVHTTGNYSLLRRNKE